MKRFMTLMLGLTFILATSSFAFAQEQKEEGKIEKSKGKKKAKKKGQKKGEEKPPAK